MGGEVLMSSHPLRFLPYEDLLKIAKAQQERGVDIVKIVTLAESENELRENFEATLKLKKDLEKQFLFLCGGKCRLVRNLGGELGCCMYLCVEEYDNFSTPAQPLLKNLKMIRDGLDDYKDEV